MDLFNGKPAVVQSAEDVTALFGEVKAHHHAVEVSGRQALDAAKKAGQALLKAKKVVPHGQWGKTVEKHMPGQYRTARVYMRVAENWSKVARAGTITEALKMLTDDLPDEPAEEAPKLAAAANLPSNPDQSDAPNSNGGQRSGGPGGRGSGGGSAPASPPPPPAAPPQKPEPPSGVDIAVAGRQQAEHLVVSLMERLTGLTTSVLGPQLLEALEARKVQAEMVRVPREDRYGKDTGRADRTYRWPQLEAILTALAQLKPRPGSGPTIEL